jgi:ACT domain-containing protein
VEDKPGGLEALLRIVSQQEANIIDINFDRYSVEIPFNYVVVKLAVETKNLEHSQVLSQEIQKQFQVY